ncbi:MAG TPA: hypothetical protein VLT62_07065, partial [Candidatus Methylomirabilis sp.]|nr:hypothetical protein [Candidatus Methylomirabilis sp.]
MIDAGTAVGQIVAVAGRDRVVPRIAVDGVAAVPGADGIAPALTVDLVGPAARSDGVAALGACVLRRFIVA